VNCSCFLLSELQRVLSESGALPLRSLVIIPDAQVWTVNIDVLVMDSGGNLLDAIVMAVKAALLTTTLPPLEIITGDGGAPEITVNDDPFSHLPLPHVARLPLAITLSKVAVGTQSEWIIDATSDEEQCSSVRLTLSLAPDGRMCGLSKSGVGTLQLPALDAIMAHASQLGVQLNKLLADEVNRGRGDVEEATTVPTAAPVPVAAAAAKTAQNSSSKKKKKQRDDAMVE
jgi:exosome complex component RRP42